MKFLNKLSFFLLYLLTLSSFSQSNYVDSLQVLTESSDLYDRANSLLLLSEHYQVIDSSKARLYYHEFESLDFTELQDSIQDKIVEHQVDFLKKSFQHDLSIHVLKQKIREATSANDSNRLALYHQMITPNYFYKFQYDSCSFHLDKAYEIYENKKDTGELGLLLTRKSGINYAIGNYEKAIQYAFEATELFKTTENEKQIAIAYLQLGNIFFFLHDISEAEKYYKLSSKAFLNVENHYGHYTAVSNLGLIKMELGVPDSCIYYQRDALSYFKNNRLELETGNAYQYISGSFYALNQIDSAKHYNELAIQSNKKTGYTIGYSEGLLMRSSIFFKEGFYNESINTAKKAYKIADSVQHFETKKQVALQLSKTFEKIDKIDSSFRYLKIHNVLRDSLDLDPKKLKEYAMLHRFQVEETQFALLLAKSKAELQEKVTKKREGQLYIAIGICITSVLLLILAIFILTRNKKLTKELSSNQKLLEDELLIKESLLSEIHHRVKNNLQVISSMLSLQSQYIDDAEFQKIITDCKGRITSMSLIHESLYKKIDGKEAHFSRYIKNLIPRLIEAYQIDESKIKLSMDVQEIYLSLDESIPCGLIINEIVSNSLKHAFPDERNGEISISLIKVKEIIQLHISDNGVGLTDIKPMEEQDSFGFLLIDTLTNQLEAELSINTDHGLTYLISWRTKS